MSEPIPSGDFQVFLGNVNPPIQPADFYRGEQGFGSCPRKHSPKWMKDICPTGETVSLTLVAEGSSLCRTYSEHVYQVLVSIKNGQWTIVSPICVVTHISDSPDSRRRHFLCVNVEDPNLVLEEGKFAEYTQMLGLELTLNDSEEFDHFTGVAISMGYMCGGVVNQYDVEFQMRVKHKRESVESVEPKRQKNTPF